jgi:hypothetical protein
MNASTKPSTTAAGSLRGFMAGYISNGAAANTGDALRRGHIRWGRSTQSAPAPLSPTTVSRSATSKEI